MWASAACAGALLLASPALAATGAVSGTVTNSEGHTLAGVSVIATREGAGFATSTASNGTYEIGNLASGAYTVSFSASGYLTQFYDGASSSSHAKIVKVTGGSTASGVDAHMQLAGAITGTVTDAGGSPLENVGVSLERAGVPVAGGGTQTGSGGAYAISGLTPGTYTVRFAAAPQVAGFKSGGGNYLPQFYSGRSTATEADAVTVTGGATTSGIDAHLAAGGEIAGTVSEGSGAPVNGLLVTAYAASGEQVGAWYTDSEGHYLIDQLPSGTYALGFGTNQPFAPVYVPTYRAGRPTLAGASGVVVTAGSTTEANEHVVRGGVVSGIVTDSHGTPIPNVGVELLRSGGEDVAGGQTGSDGRYAIGGLESGSYVLRFYPRPAGPMGLAGSGNFLSTYFDAQATLAAADPVTVDVGATTSGINEVLPAGAEITGTVTAAVGGKALGRVNVTAYGASGNPVLTGETSASGEYALEGLQSGSYRVQFQVFPGPPFEPGPGNFAPQYSGGAATLASATAVSVTAGGAPGVLDAQLQPGATISGLITNAEGEGLNGAGAGASDLEGNRAGGASAHPDGSYTIEDLAAGSYRLEFSGGSVEIGEAGFAPQFYKDVPALSEATAVTLAAGGSASGIDAKLAAGSAVSGTVAEAGGAPLFGFGFVALYDEAGQPVGSVFVGNGRWFIGGLRAGTYRIGFTEIGPDGYSPTFYGGSSLAGATPVVVAPGATVGGVAITVTRADGSLSGVVANGSAPAPSGKVVAYDSAGRPAAEAITGGTGAYSLGGLAEGFYRLAYTASGASVSYFFGGSATLAQSTPLLASSGADGGEIDFQLAGSPSGPTGAGSAGSPPPGPSSGLAGIRVESPPHLTQAQKRARAIAACRKLRRSRRARCIAAAKRRYPTEGECRSTYRTWQRGHRHSGAKAHGLERAALRRRGCRL